MGIINCNSFCVIYLDSFLKQDSEIKALRLILSECRFMILTAHVSEWEMIFPDDRVERFRFNLPDFSFVNSLVRQYNCHIENVVFISDDYDFLKNSMGLFSTSVFIGDKNVLEYGKYPDYVFRSAEKLLKYRDREFGYVGEMLIHSHDGRRLSGKIASTRKRVGDRTINILFSGRYYGINHYRGSFDYLSYAIRMNKNLGSRLYTRFNESFRRILSAEVKMIRKHVDVDMICSVPDHPKHNGAGKFSSIIEAVADENGICNIQKYIHCIKDFPSQKSKETQFDREQNIKGAFSCDIDLTGKCIILFDDILTTGATLTECANMLFEKGADDVICAVIAVNQFPVTTPLSDYTESFGNHYKLRGNSTSLIPFFSKEGESIGYEDGMNMLLNQINAEIISKKTVETMQFDDIPF